MFEGRWRIKGKYVDVGILLGDNPQESIKALCRDFFEAGILLTGGTTIKDGQFTTSELDLADGTDCGAITVMHDPIIDTADNGFSEWWEMYDKKCGRKDCEKKWKKLTELEKSECIAATPAYVRSTPDKQFRKNPLTYLNQKAWNDEIIYRNAANTQHIIQQQRISKLADILAG